MSARQGVVLIFDFVKTEKIKKDLCAFFNNQITENDFEIFQDTNFEVWECHYNWNGYDIYINVIQTSKELNIKSCIEIYWFGYDLDDFIENTEKANKCKLRLENILEKGVIIEYINDNYSVRNGRTILDGYNC